MEESTINQWCTLKLVVIVSYQTSSYQNFSLLGSQRQAYSTVAAYQLFNNMTVHIIIDKKGEAMFYLLRVRYWYIDDYLYHFAEKYTPQLSK